MKFLVPNYSCLQNPCPGGYRPPRSPISLSSTEFVEPPTKQNSWVCHWLIYFVLLTEYITVIAKHNRMVPIKTLDNHLSDSPGLPAGIDEFVLALPLWLLDTFCCVCFIPMNKYVAVGFYISTCTGEVHIVIKQLWVLEKNWCSGSYNIGVPKKTYLPLSFLIIKPMRCTNFSNLFWNRTLHVSDRFTVHRLESSAAYTAIGVCCTGYVVC